MLVYILVLAIILLAQQEKAYPQHFQKLMDNCVFKIIDLMVLLWGADYM
jgi:hypothetical protein